MCGRWLFSNPATNIFTVVYEVLATANQDRSQITCYAANGDWVATCYVMCFEIYSSCDFHSTLGVARTLETAVQRFRLYIIKQTVMLGTLEH